MKDELNEIRSKRVCSSVRDNIQERLVRTEQRCADQEQYIRGECVGIVGLLENLNG